MRVFRIAAGIAVAALFLFLLFRSLDIEAVLAAARRLSPAAVSAAVASVLVAYLLRARRWQLLLGGAGVATGYATAARMFFASFAINNVLPLRAGDVYRCAATSRLKEGSVARALAALAIERLLDIGVLAALLGGLLIVVPPGGLAILTGGMIVLLAVMLALVVFLFAMPSAVPRVVTALLSLVGLDRVPRLRKAVGWLTALAWSTHAILGHGNRFIVILLSLAAWLCELAVFVVVGSALAGSPLLVAGGYAGLLGTFATLVPSTPGHLGTFDYFAAAGFREGGLGADAAAAAALVSHLVILVPVTLIGAIALIGGGRHGVRR